MGNFKRYTPVLLVALLIFSLYYKLGYENINVDQFLWYTRSQNFFKAVSEGSYLETYQQYHPGVLLMYLIGLGQLSYRLFTGDQATYPDISYVNFGTYNFFTKFYTVSFSLVLLLVSSYMLYRITSSKQFTYVFLTALYLEAYFVGVLRNLHLDGLLSVLLFSTVIAFYLAVTSRSWKYLLVSGLLMGLGLLTKSTAIFAAAFCFLVLIYFSFAKKGLIRWLLKAWLIWMATAAGVFFVLFPAMWVAPVSTIQKIVLDGVLETGANGGFTHVVNDISSRDPGPLFYLQVVKFRITPLTQLSATAFFVCSAFFVASNRTVRDRLTKYIPPALPLYLLSVLFIIIYLAIFTLASKKTDRYITPIFPFLVLDSVCALSFVYRLTLQKTLTRVLFYIFLTVFMLYGVVNMLTIAPYGMAYYNHVWGGINKAKKQIYLNQGGIGYFELAAYLNSLNIPSDTIIGATNDTELEKLVRYPVTAPQPKKRKEYKLVVLPLQKDALYKSSRKLAYKLNIQGQNYWNVYYRDLDL